MHPIASRPLTMVAAISLRATNLCASPSSVGHNFQPPADARIAVRNSYLYRFALEGDEQLHPSYL